MQRALIPSLAALALLTSAPAQAQEPPSFQANGGVRAGVAGQGSGAFWDETLFHGGLHGDLLFGRKGTSSWGIGPGFGLSTNHFRDLNLGAGLSVLAPIHDYLPLVLTAGPYARWDGSLKPGLSGSLFWGARSFNYHGRYNAAGGVVVEARYGLGDDRERTLIVAAHVDAEIVILPALFLINAFR